MNYFTKQTVIFFCFSVFLFILFSKSTFAAPPDSLDPAETFVRATVTKIVAQGTQSIGSTKSYTQRLQAELLEGKQKGKFVSLDYSIDSRYVDSQKLQIGDSVIIDSRQNPDKSMLYSIYEPYRLPLLWWILGAFIVLVMLIAGRKGLGALVGLLISIGIISFYIVPSIIKGADPLTVSCIGACGILFFTTYIAHGVSVKTTVALIGTGIALVCTVLLSVWVVTLLHLFGLGNEDIQALVVGTNNTINPQGLLLGGILIGTLGALNDVTTTQSITMFTLVSENPKQSLGTLFQKGMAIGKEHIASIINTLVLAYAGTSLAIFIFFSLNPAHLPFWILLNNETTIEEVARTIVGSSGLMLAVPITTLLACFIALKRERIEETIYRLLR